MPETKPSISASKDALAAIFGKGSSKAEVGSEPPSGAQGEGTQDKPYDQGNAPEQANTTAPASSETNQGSGLPQAEPNATKPNEVKASKSHMESVMGKKPEPTPKAEEAPASTPVAAPAPAEKATEQPKKEEDTRARKDWPSTRAGQQERSVSPGTLDDGSHVTTSGDKGEGYKPKGKIGNFFSKH